MAVSEAEPDAVGPLDIGLRPASIRSSPRGWCVRWSATRTARTAASLRERCSAETRVHAPICSLAMNLRSLLAVPATAIDVGFAAFDPRRRGFGYMRDSQVALPTRRVP
jgi:hypothetical protein